MKVLLDEMMPASLIARLATKGISAVHVSHLGRSGHEDHQVWSLAFEQDRIVVTKNAGDFMELAATWTFIPVSSSSENGRAAHHRRDLAMP